jgi:putative tryptophan/tyrosine transport system substrate-binding protein
VTSDFDPCETFAGRSRANRTQAILLLMFLASAKSLRLGATMRRRDFILASGATVAWPLATRAQQPAMSVIGNLVEVPPGPLVDSMTAARQRGMAEIGYVEGKDYTTENRIGPESLPQAAADLVRLNVNVILAAGPMALAAASKATTSIPVIGIDLESDPVAKGYVKSLARPGGNITGMFLDIPELSGKQVGLLKELVPGLSRIAIFGVPGLNALQFKATETAARALNVEAEIMEIRVADDVPPAIEAARARYVESGILLSSPLVYVFSREISELALAKRLPLISLLDAFPKNGGLLSYGPNLGEIFRRSASYLTKILQGAKPNDLPIQRPEKFDLVINLKTAKVLGVTVPPMLLATADEVIE